MLYITTTMNETALNAQSDLWEGGLAYFLSIWYTDGLTIYYFKVDEQVTTLRYQKRS